MAKAKGSGELMLAFRPKRQVGDFKGYRIYLESESTTEDYIKFEEVCKEFEKLLDVFIASRGAK